MVDLTTKGPTVLIFYITLRKTVPLREEENGRVTSLDLVQFIKLALDKDQRKPSTSSGSYSSE